MTIRRQGRKAYFPNMTPEEIASWKLNRPLDPKLGVWSDADREDFLARVEREHGDDPQIAAFLDKVRS